MSAFYFSIIQYVPDTFRQERLNLGIALASEEPPHFAVRFLPTSAMDRLKHLGFETDFDYIREIESEMKSNGWSLTLLQSATKEWANTIQFSEVRGALSENAPLLLKQLYKRYVDPPHRQPREEHEGKQWIKKKVGRALRDTIRLRFPNRNVSNTVKRDSKVRGHFEEHRFDYALHNGGLAHLVHSFSFDTPHQQTLKTEVDATAWAIEDLKRARIRVPISIVTSGDLHGKALEAAKRIYPALGADVVNEERFETWLNSLSL
jgi:DUF3037 family protein